MLLEAGVAEDACEGVAIELLLFLRFVNPNVDFSREVMGTECAHTRSQEGEGKGERGKKDSEWEGRERKRGVGGKRAKETRALL